MKIHGTLSGTLRKVNMKKRYGFVRSKDWNEDVFFHFSENDFPVKESDVGKEVIFLIREVNHRGERKWHAFGIQVVKQAKKAKRRKKAA